MQQPHNRPIVTQQMEQDLPSQVSQDFSLRRIAYLLPVYTPPPVANFNPTEDWKQDYTMYLLQPLNARKVGRFSLERSSKGSKQFILKVLTQRVGNSGYSQFQHAELNCRTDLLATPESWVFDTKMALTPNGKPYLLSGRRHSARVSNGILAIRDNFRTSAFPIPGRYSNEWTLLEAVQRLPGQMMQPIDYTLIDEFDTPWPNHRLAYRTQAHLHMQGGSEMLTAYYDLGRAVVPTVYWVDKHGRLIFVCTGLQIYALTATNGKSGQLPHQYPTLREDA